MARRTKLTPAIQTRIVKAILAGNYFDTACSYANVALKTAYEWLSRGEGKGYAGRSKTQQYAEFAEAIRQAEATAEMRAVRAISKGFSDNPRLALDFLARRHPERWGPRETLTILQKLIGKVEGMTDAELLAYINNRRMRGDATGSSGNGGGAEEGAGCASD